MAADVPKKLGKVSVSEPLPGSAMSEPKKVVLAPSGAMMRGLLRKMGLARRVPAVSNRIGVPPADEEPSASGGLTPKAGVLL